ncbi:MAG TPA: CAP domain-containing protein [Chloroflexota bacterium]|nr:CAP domain-containing protein [Chloroflexota bacterium]
MKLHLRAAALLLLVAIGAASVRHADAEIQSASLDSSTAVRQVVELTNQERMKAGLLPLKWNDSLASAASGYAQDLAARNYFAHNSPEGSTPVERARQAGYEAYGWGGLYEGENLARGFSTAEGAMRGWMNSEGHRKNLLNPNYREIGVGVAAASNGALVWAQEFGSRPKVLPVFINGGATSTDSQQVTLSMTTEQVSSWGSVGKITSMMVSNRAEYGGASWESFSPTRQWVLTDGPGVKRVYVRLRDENGTVADSTAEITLATQQALGMPSGSKVQFQLGFRTLADLIPEVVGEPLTAEQSTASGDCYQPTSTGMMVWRKADNFTAFTDGGRSWINGPYGVQARANSERFSWER